MGRSSSFEDVRQQLLLGLLDKYCGLGSKPVFLVVDGEIAITIYVLQCRFPDNWNNLVLLPPPFHSRMHLQENICYEPVTYMLLLAP